jgi:hypothetical protein
MINNFKEDMFEQFINATMSPDKQLGKLKDVPDGSIIDVCYIVQEETTRTKSGESAVVTTIVDSNGTSYQTLSDFVGKFFANVAKMKDPATWPEHPIKIQTVWKPGKQGDWLSIKIAD